jgi:hypothetical protein
MATEEKQPDKKQAAPTESTGTPISKEEAEEIKNDVLKSVVGGDGGNEWIDADVWVKGVAFLKWTSA